MTSPSQHSHEGLPEVISIPTDGEVLSDDDCKERVRAAFDGQLLGHGDLTEQLQAQFRIGRNKAVGLLADYVRKGWIMKNGPNRSKTTMYKCML